ncbi:hypothetical protein L0F63_001074, partial [Massospora cicadina]
EDNELLKKVTLDPSSVAKLVDSSPLKFDVFTGDRLDSPSDAEPGPSDDAFDY